MKRCKFCGRTGTRAMTEIRNRWIDNRIDGWKCTSPIACIRRQEQLGQWIGKRVIIRFDPDGTHWTIRRHDDPGLRGMTSGPWSSGFVLICEYRQHRSTSWHPTVQLAQAHRDDVVASWKARSMREYAEGRP